MFAQFKKIGPGAMVAAAFIGPGTVTTATLAGADYGYTLLWAVVFSVVATYVLQEMSVRLGIAGKLGLGEAIRQKVPRGAGRLFSTLLVLGAILIGNAAYEAGNITGAVLGFLPIWDFPGMAINPLIIFIGLLAFALLYTGRYKLIERVLILLVTIMGVVFLFAAILSSPNISEVLQGLLVPSIPDDGLIMVMGLIGTTVVPYNLFLHASAVQERWKDVTDIKDARFDALLSIVGGGIITAAIIIAAAAVDGEKGEVSDISGLASSLQPILGDGAGFFMAFGFLAAGLSSAVTAPLAAAYATSGVLGWSSDLSSVKFRLVWMSVLMVGILFASLGFKPIQVILFAQVANGILLPVIAAFLLWTMNDRKIIGSFTNSLLKNILGILVLVIALLLGIKSILTVSW